MATAKKKCAEAMGMILLTISLCLAFSSLWGCTPLSATTFVKDSTGCLHITLYNQLSEGMVTKRFAESYYSMASISQNMTGEQIQMVSPITENTANTVYLIDPLVKPTNFKFPTLMQATCAEGEYNELGTLLLRSGTSSVKNLFTRGAPHLLSLEVLILFLVLYFFLSAITSGIAVPSGLFVPQILIGATMGRIVCMLEIMVLKQICTNLSEYSPEDLTVFQWEFGGYRAALQECQMPDPGTYSIVGAAAFLGGSGRISVFLAVVILELTNDIQVLPVVAGTVLVAVIVGNALNHGLYHALLHVMSLPFLNPKSAVEMRFYPVSLIMAKRKELVTLNRLDMNENLVKCLNSRHNAFPVLERGKLIGMVNRNRLQQAIDDKFVAGEVPLTLAAPYVMYGNISIAKAYDAFRSLGLRHLCCITREGDLAGLVTRKDLMMWRLHEKLGVVDGHSHSH